MTNIDWAESARDELADAYVTATPEERQLMIVAVMSIEQSIAENPLETGESRSPGLRFEFRTPLGFWFSVNADASHARIVRITRPPRRSPG